MSLLNEALRKKSQEKNPSGSPPPIFSGRGRRPRCRGKSLWAALILFIGAGLLAALLLPDRGTEVRRASAPAATTPLSAAAPGNTVTTPQPAPSQPEAAMVAATAQDDTKTGAPRKPAAEADTPGATASRPAPMTTKPVAAPAKQKQTAHLAAAVAEQNARLQAPIAAYWQKALSYHRQKQFSQAITMYQEVLKRAPDHAEAQLNLAAAYLETRSFSQAHTLLTPLADQMPENPRIWMNLAVAAIGQGRAEEALDSLQRAERYGAAPFDVYLHRGAALRQAGKTEDAIASYRQAERIKPEDSSLTFNLAVVYDQEERFADALKYYQRFLLLDTTSSPMQRKKVEERAAILRAFLATSGGKSQPS